MRVYLSSTFEDLELHRVAASEAIRRLGHQVVQMEDYGSANVTPLQKVVEDVRSCDAFVGIYAWRRGSVPEEADQPSVPRLKNARIGDSSFTEWELAAAQAGKNTVLLFILEENAPWPPHFIEGLEDSKKFDRVKAFRDGIRRSQLVAHFRSPEDLGQKVATSLAASETTRQLKVFLVEPAKFQTEDNVAFESSNLDAIKKELSRITSHVAANASQRTIKINLSTRWWSTRIFLVAFMAEKLTRIRRILITSDFKSADGAVEEQFVGLLPTETAVSTIGNLHRGLLNFVATATTAVTQSANIDTDINNLVNVWMNSFTEAPEYEIAQVVSTEDLGRWFGHALLRRALYIRDVEHPTPLELALVMNYPHDFVPVEWIEEVKVRTKSVKTSPTIAFIKRVDVVDQSELSRRIAQRYVNDQIGRIVPDVGY
jgi:hypothetical protein